MWSLDFHILLGQLFGNISGAYAWRERNGPSDRSEITGVMWDQITGVMWDQIFYFLLAFSARTWCYSAFKLISNYRNHLCALSNFFSGIFFKISVRLIVLHLEYL